MSDKTIKISEEILHSLLESRYLFNAVPTNGGFRDVGYDESIKIIETIRFSELSEIQRELEHIFNYSPDTIECYKNDKMYECPQYDESKCDCWLPNITEKNMFCAVDRLEKRRTRTTKEYREWRESVLERDGSICQECKAENTKLHVHHIKEYSKFPEGRLDIDNGISLCKKCHKKIHRKKE